MLVPNTPVEFCLDCGMIYYDAVVLKEIEKQFFAIHNNSEEPDQYIEMPTKAYAHWRDEFINLNDTRTRKQEENKRRVFPSPQPFFHF